jgi:hypothetical protein
MHCHLQLLLVPHDLKVSRANTAPGIRLSKLSSPTVGWPHVHNPDGVAHASSCGLAAPNFFFDGTATVLGGARKVSIIWHGRAPTHYSVTFSRLATCPYLQTLLVHVAPRSLQWVVKELTYSSLYFACTSTTWEAYLYFACTRLLTKILEVNLEN